MSTHLGPVRTEGMNQAVTAASTGRYAASSARIAFNSLRRSALAFG